MAGREKSACPPEEQTPAEGVSEGANREPGPLALPRGAVPAAASGPISYETFCLGKVLEMGPPGEQPTVTLTRLLGVYSIVSGTCEHQDVTFMGTQGNIVFP